MLDWRHFTKQNYIKDLPLHEQKRRYMKLDIKMTTLTELITENGDFALRTETSGDNLITDQQF